MKHKTAELEGALLDAAVAKALGHEPFFGPPRPGQEIPSSFHEDQWRFHNGWPVWRYGAEWVYGGPIIERERIELMRLRDEDGWVAATVFHQGSAATPLIAAMRAFVASKLGEEVEL